ncbi:mechanosensitive ion channel protein MscS [Microbacterium sp. Y-01]|uniref:DUF4229 domain-containing protein n=1 Tax=Microbacterium sp. Y-01 TaxID=2048898 RepID=UPI000F5F2309|nr:DUF4229 domain-containing protein [Microbacterium sp. Y-01]AZH79690.1 mechanosensitive ion channel protein MscS [Microbacterium sp. Y-01]
MKKSAPLLVYSVLRLLAFLVPLAILWLFFPIFRELWWLAAIFAALIGVSISMLFLRAPLTDASARLHERREARTTGAQADAETEDAVIDAEPPASDSDSPTRP